MAGAAWDTIIGQAVTMLAAIFYLVKKRIGFSAPQAKTLFSLFEFVLKVAVAPLGLTFSPQITTILMNRFLMIYDGEQVVAVYGCIAYVAAIAYLLLQGVGDGSQPLISRFFSEDNLPTMKQMRKYDYLTAATIGIGCFAVFFLAQNHVGILFGASVETNGSVSFYLPFFLIVLVLLSYVRITTAFRYATEKSILSYLLVYAEPVCILLFLLVLPNIPALGLQGVWFSVPLAQCVTWGIAFLVQHRIDHNLIHDIAKMERSASV